MEQKRHLNVLNRFLTVAMAATLTVVPITGYAAGTSTKEQTETRDQRITESGTPEVPLPIKETKNGKTFTMEKTFSTMDRNDTGRDNFDDVVEKAGKSYELSSIDTEVLNTQTIEGDTYIYTTAHVANKEELPEPEEEIEHNGAVYRLRSKTLKELENEAFTKKVERTVILSDIEDNDQIPGLAEITETDSLGKEVSKYMPLISFKVEKENWDSSFEFPIKITDYDSDTFILNGTEIKKGEDLIKYERQFLEYLGLSRDYYRITSIDWDGEEYRSGGSVCRNAIARGDKVVKDITAIYGGEMVFGEVTQYAYECVYFNPEKPDTTVYTIKATATYKEIIPETAPDNKEDEETEPEPLVPTPKKRNVFQKMADWVVQNPIAALGIGTLLVVAIGLMILFLLSRKKKEEEENKFDIIDLDHKDE